MSRELVQQLIHIRNRAVESETDGLGLVPARIAKPLNSIKSVISSNLKDSNIEKLIPDIRPILFVGPYRSEDVLRVSKQLLSYARRLQDRSSLVIATSNLERVVPNTRDVFVIHGHDHGNLFRVRELIAKRFALNPIILSEQPDKGRSIIEKFEDEANTAGYAIAILTPDDVVNASDPYRQARPNVVFELGWFYGRLGRDRVCILSKKGTAIHSDLGGIIRVEFENSVDEAVLGLERELRAAGLLVPSP